MAAETLLRLTYGANILLLVPAMGALLSGPASRVFGAAAPESPALKSLVAALWGAILACSVVGLWRPREMAAILLLQVVYKAAWLLLFVLPAWRAGGPAPVRTAAAFLPMVVLWPLVLVRAWAG